MDLLNQNKTQIKTKISYVLISVCTCKRPKMLKDALLSVNTIKVPENINVEVLVVDNDENCSAKNIIAEIIGNYKFKLHYFVEPKRGIANARNRVLDEAVNLGASHILFFDDDELIQENCLIEHINYYNSNPDAVIISGPTINKFDESYPEYVKKHMVFKQHTTKKTGLIRENCAAGNVFFPVSVASNYGLKFSNEYIFMGGEDGEFFSRASKAGFTIVWNNDAIIYEVVPPARANIKYILKKCYYNGYAGVYFKFKQRKPNRFIYVTKTLSALILNICLLPFSILFGLTGFFNVLGLCFKTFGKIDCAIKNTSCDFYKNIYGE